MDPLFQRFVVIYAKDQQLQIDAKTSAAAEMHDLLEAERGLRRDAEAELRPFRSYVENADAIAAQAAADAAAERDAMAPDAPMSEHRIAWRNGPERLRPRVDRGLLLCPRVCGGSFLATGV